MYDPESSWKAPRPAATPSTEAPAPPVEGAPAPLPVTLAPGSDGVLHYRSDVPYDVLCGSDSTLVSGECCIVRRDETAWVLGFCFTRENDGKRKVRIIPVNPGGPAGGGPDTHSWGLNFKEGRWAVTPSINCLDFVWGEDGKPKRDADGKPIQIEVWHKNAVIVGVADGEPWEVKNV